MKEIQPITPQITDKEVNEQQIPQQQARVHSRTKIPGHTVFELDIEHMIIRVVNPVGTAVVDLEGNTAIKNKVQMRRNCYYCQALNKKNAEKKFSAMIREQVGKDFMMFCTDDEWKLLSFAQKITLIKNLLGI